MSDKEIMHQEGNIEGENRSVTMRRFPIIGMGGSASSFQSFEKFFIHMPKDSGMAFVVIMHQDPQQEANTAVLLQKHTAMPVQEAEDGMQIEHNKIYVIPADKDMGLHHGRLLLFKPRRAKGAQMPIDYFLQSLAEDQWNQAVAIIFSGMGADGETGIRMIKEKLGMAMVQDPQTAEYPSMPNASISTGQADYVLAPEEMPLKLINYMSHPMLNEEDAEDIIAEKNTENHIQKILMILRSHIGHDFSLYKKNTITRRVDRRIAFHQLPDYVHYVNFLRENPQEIDVLFNELLIGVTKFFRDKQAYDLLEEKFINLIKAKNPEDPIRIWVAGCSTGEEAYSMAILVMEFLESQKKRNLQKVQIFATDLDANAIEHARKGVYFENIASEISPERLTRFFVKQNNCYVVKKELREMIVFAQHNLIKDAPFTRLDLLCCRNVMIYLTTDMACTREAIDRMKKYRLGHIVNVGSMSADVREEGSSVYVATKAAIQGFSEALRKEVNQATGVKITLIEPGATGTDMQPVSPEDQQKQEEDGEMLKAEDVAGAILYALSQPRRCDVVAIQIRPHFQLI